MFLASSLLLEILLRIICAICLGRSKKVLHSLQAVRYLPPFVSTKGKLESILCCSPLVYLHDHANKQKNKDK